MMNLLTKFEVPNFIRYRDMKGAAKCRRLPVDGLRLLGVTQGYRQWSAYDFLFIFNKNYAFILYRFRATFCRNSTTSAYPTSIRRPPLQVTIFMECERRTYFQI